MKEIELSNNLQHAADLHAKAVKIISAALAEMSRLEMNQMQLDHNAAAIIARLAHANIALVEIEQCSN